MTTVEQETLLLQAQAARDLAQRSRRQAERAINADDQGRLLSQAEQLANRARQLEEKANSPLRPGME
ncbi:MAG: hypothetical protein JSS04_25730 [Proteobacteria bacterium]|nr:hypothetical protein [Pseudomonadota bacterium]